MTTAQIAAPELRAPWWTRTQLGVVVLAAIIVGAFFILHIPAVGHWVTYWTGQDAESGGHYGAWSGILGSIQPTLILTAIVVYWRTSCHNSSCWLPGRFKSADGTMHLCRYHHPHIRGRKVTQELIQELHELHLSRVK